MSANSYDSPNAASNDAATQSSGCAATLSFSPAVKIALCVVGLAMFATTPWRDLWFYKDIAGHEGFGTTNDSYIIGVAGQFMATIFFFPVALFLIVVGVARSTRFTIFPRFDRFTWGWALPATLTAMLMLLIESGYVVYGLHHRHHLDTVLISLAYMGYIYVWWCCSLSHGPGTTRT